jgi:hypothetical protein
MLRFGEPMLDVIGLADYVEANLAGLCRVPVARLIGELDAIAHREALVRDAIWP